MSFLRLQISEDWTVVVLGLAIIFLALLGIVIPSPIFNWTNAGDLTNVVFSGKNLLAILAQFVLIYGVAILAASMLRSEEHTSELQSRENLVCRLLLEKKKKQYK